MAKSTASKKTVKEAPAMDTNAAFSKKNSAALSPADDNPAKFQPTADAEMDTMLLDPSDGVLKLFTDCIKDIYWAENHLVKYLPKMIKSSSLPALQQGIAEHLEQTKTHVQRLEQVFELLGKKPQAKKCDAMEGLTREGEGVIEMTDIGTPARNLGIILSSQKVEHYEIASYTGLVKLATGLGLSDVAAILSETLSEEEASDAKLGDIADQHMVNFDDGPGVGGSNLDDEDDALLDGNDDGIGEEDVSLEEDMEADDEEDGFTADDQSIDEVEPLDDEKGA